MSVSSFATPAATTAGTTINLAIPAATTWYSALIAVKAGFYNLTKSATSVQYVWFYSGNTLVATHSGNIATNTTFSLPADCDKILWYVETGNSPTALLTYTYAGIYGSGTTLTTLGSINTVTTSGPVSLTGTVNYVIAFGGGGGAGGTYIQGGGGGGGSGYCTVGYLPRGTFTATIGAGGIGGTDYNIGAGGGGTTSISTISANGGGGGGSGGQSSGDPTYGGGGAGGSGGGNAPGGSGGTNGGSSGGAGSGITLNGGNRAAMGLTFGATSGSFYAGGFGGNITNVGLNATGYAGGGGGTSTSRGKGGDGAAGVIYWKELS